MTPIPKFAFFGTPSVARDTLDLLAERSVTPALIVTNPDAPRGRGHILTPSEVKTWALAHDVPVETPEKLDAAALDTIASYGYAFAIVVAYGKIFPEELIARFPHGVINIHYSLLPKYRGASPVEAALKNGDTVTGVSIQKMVREVDAGDVLAVRGVSIAPDETARELRPRLIREGAKLLADILPAFVSGSLDGAPQDATQATYAPKIKKEDGLLTLTGDARTNWNTYRAYIENPGTYFFANREGKRIRVKVARARFENETFIPERVIPEGKNEQDFTDLLRAGWVAE
ncbi:MAG TPA: methionyl-tRNA formyltransferase [Candidatus Paceibacterota bacterium]